MPLSISSSEQIAAAQERGRLSSATIAFLGLAILLGLGTEAAARFGLTRISTINGRIMRERSQALAIRPGVPGSFQTVLFAGNSLFLEGVDFPRLTVESAPRFKTHRYVIEATDYLDWYYGLRSMFRQGMKPDLVVVCLNPKQLVTDGINGGFSARFLFGLPEIQSVARDIHAGPTEIAELYASHFSTFYGARAQLRGALLLKFVPAVPTMWQKATLAANVAPKAGISWDAMVPRMEFRMKALKDLCEANGSKFALLIPPTNQKGDTQIVSAGEQTGVQVLHPIPNSSLKRTEFYRDGFHLNRAGAALFTNAIAQQLQKLP